MERRVWVLFPSANVEIGLECTRKWKAQGYSVAIQRDEAYRADECDFTIVCSYGGYWDAINRLYRAIGDRGDCFVAIGDDQDPDPNHTAQEISEMYFERFPNGEGIMQPCGDPQGSEIDGKMNAERICGSPWWGHVWADFTDWEEPMPHGFWHFYGDEFIKLYAEKFGILWMNKDLTQWHWHWSYSGKKPTDYQKKNQESWKKDQEHFHKMCELYGLEP